MLLRVFLFFILTFSVAADTLTSANLEGQKNLFKKGWFIIASPVEAWNFAQENSEKSREAFKRALKKASDEASAIDMKENLSKAQATMESLQKSGRKNSTYLHQKASSQSKKQLHRSSKQFIAAWKKLNLGYVHYRKTNQDDLDALIKVNKDFFKRSNEHFEDMDNAIKPITGYFEERHAVEWGKHFKEGQRKFNEKLDDSGQRGNSLIALWDVFLGYAKFAYHAVVKPTGKVAENGIKNPVYYTSSAILKTAVISHNIVYSVGANLYYTTKLGFKLVSPTVEAGLLASMALINVASAPVTWGSLETAGVINKVAVETTAPVAAGAQYVLFQSADGAQKAAIYLMHGSRGTAEVGFEKIESGVALGYSALSQIPPQLLLTSINSVIFLVVDGPRILLMKAQGKIGDKDITEIPVGSVMDMKKLQESGVDVTPITNDEFILKKVLQYAE